MWRVRTTFAALALVLVGAACSGDGAPDRRVAPPATTGATTTTAAPETTTEPTAPPEPDLGAVRVQLTTLASGLDQPLALAVRRGDAALYVAEKTGRIRVVRDGRLDPEPYLDLSSEVSGGSEQGLLGLAFDPSGERLVVDYTDRSGDTHVDEYALRGGRPDPASRRRILFVRQPYRNHNGGQVTFGPDGMLYIGLGDGGSGGDPQGNAQNLSTLLGSILRVDPSRGDPYAVPGDNPFVGRRGAAGEIWQYGLRNPWRFSFDRDTGDLWIGDVGQNAWEEIDFAPSGEVGVNWGWNLREGTHRFAGERPAGARDPIHEYPNPDDGVAVTGGYVYRGEAVPALRGVYVYADYSKGDLVGIVERDGRAVEVRSLGVNSGTVSSFGEDAAGELYVCDLSGGRLLRVDPA
jgi:glucose/arabinose dehydrogenase